MTEHVEPGDLSTEPKPKRKLTFKVTDAIVFGVIIIVIVGLSLFITNKLSLKRDAAAGQKVADKAIAALQHRDGTAARSLGSDTFKKTYSADTLTKQFKAVEVATTKPPKLDRTTVYTGTKGRSVYYIYKYSALKVPFYVRVVTTKTADSWKLTQISGSADESTLLL